MTYEEWKESIDEKYGEGYFETERKKVLNYSSDKKQYEKYKSVLGKENLPKTFDLFQDLKYNNIKEWELLKNYKMSIQIGELSPLSNFELYKHINTEIDEKLIGVFTDNGIKITGKSSHFIARTIGSVEQKRNGVNVDISLETITKPGKIEPIRNNANGNSHKFISEKAAVSVNPDTGILIQVNPLHKKSWRENNDN